MTSVTKKNSFKILLQILRLFHLFWHILVIYSKTVQ
jgi:hypothetical protein